MQIHNVDETNDDTSTMESDSHAQNDDSWSVNNEEQAENGLEIIPCGQGDVDCISDSLVGIKSEKIEDIYDLYSKHAHKVGFSVRKSTTRHNTAGLLVSRILVCACQGLRKSNTSSSSSILDESTKRKTHITRTDYKAFLRIKLNVDNGLDEVTEHVIEHNHTLFRTELSYMHCSNRTISDESAIIIEDMLLSGMRATDVYRYMAQEAGGEDMVGHTKRDHINFVNRLKILAIEGGDAQTLMDILEDQCAEQHDFFFRVRLDDDGRLCHIFWRDCMMKDDFMIFGDVMVFDTTYRTNKYNLICAPFVGVNNHKKNVMFACAFLSNEKIDTFVWLFEAFKKCMEGRTPTSLFTDQDLAITKAIEKVFPETRHRLCIWHLHQNAQAHLGRLKSDKSFGDAFQKCITGCINADDLEECWKRMVTKYDLENNSWIQRLYELREKWSNAFNREFFSAGILSSQRSESTNHALGFKAKKTTNLTEFYEIFKQTVQRWRSNELNDEYQYTRAQPMSSLPMAGIIEQASEVYTLTLYSDFEKQFFKCLSASFSLLSDEYDFKLYQVNDGHNSYKVSFYVVDPLVTCTCNMFEESGMLCSHCLRILLTHSIERIPECYIKKRWTKLAKQALCDRNFQQQSKSLPPWRHQMMRKCLNLVLQVQENDKARRVVDDELEAITSAALQELKTAMLETNESEEVGGCSGSSVSVKDPKKSVTKGRKQRIKGHFEKNTKKKRKSFDESNSIKSNEFGSKTPNQHLF